MDDIRENMMSTPAPVDKQGFCRRQVGIFLVPRGAGFSPYPEVMQQNGRLIPPATLLIAVQAHVVPAR